MENTSESVSKEDQLPMEEVPEPAHEDFPAPTELANSSQGSRNYRRLVDIAGPAEEDIDWFAECVRFVKDMAQDKVPEVETWT
jgi:hypothetical protein